MNSVVTALINEPSEQVIALLSNMETPLQGIFLPVVELLWKVHPDSDVQQAAHDKLLTTRTEEEMTIVANDLAIFKSINENLPWVGEFQDLQQQNFDKFYSKQSAYAPILATSESLIPFYLDLGRKLFMLFGLEKEARAVFDSILAHNKQVDEAYYALARIFEKNKDFNSALENYEKCLELNPMHTYGQLQLGMLLANEYKEFSKAIEHYNKVIEQNPFMAEIYVRVAEAHLALEDRKRANQFIEMALGINEFHEEALHLKGIIQWKMDEDLDAAVETFEKGLDHKIHGDSGLLLGTLGELYAEEYSDFERAKTYYQKALVAKPNQPEVLERLVAILENTYQDFGAITQVYEDFLAHTKTNPDVMAAYAGFLIKYMYDFEQAKQQIDAALDLQPDHTLSKRLLRQIGDYFDSDEDSDDDSGDDIDESEFIDIDDLLDDDDDDDDDDDFSGGGAAGDN